MYPISCSSFRGARSGRRIAISCCDTRGLAVRRIVPDWRTRLLMIITHPTIAYGLLLVGIYGLLLEGYNPGAVLPGVAGALSLLLALYGLQLLAVNYAGLALMALGVGLIAAEFFMPAFGSLGVGGLVAFVIGSIMLFDNRAPGQRVALPLIVGIAVAGGLVIAAIGWLALQRTAPARQHRCRDHDRRLVEVGTAMSAIDASCAMAESCGMPAVQVHCARASGPASSRSPD